MAEQRHLETGEEGVSGCEIFQQPPRVHHLPTRGCGSQTAASICGLGDAKLGLALSRTGEQKCTPEF